VGSAVSAAQPATSSFLAPQWAQMPRDVQTSARSSASSRAPSAAHRIQIEERREKQLMTRKCKPYIAAAICSIAVGQAWAQAPRVATLDIEWENAVGYGDNLADPSQRATSPDPVTPASIINLTPFVGIADIVSVNGKPAKGSWVLGGRIIQLVPSPMPGQAIGDLGRGALVDIHIEILQADGTRVGSIMTSGFTGGPAPPGSPPGRFCNLAVTGGTGAFEGARGTVASPNFSTRPASIAEDPSNRRVNGGTRGHLIADLVPMFWPEIVTTANGPAVFHSDFSAVTATKPSRSGETLIVRATGLGPTAPGITPGTPFPDNPLQVVNSPLEVTVNGKGADVLNKIGWPGTTDTYRVDIRVPDGTAPGMAALQVTAAFIQGQPVSIPVQ
jgi:hypothetical protein